MLQSVVVLSTTKAEYIEITEANKEAIWTKGFLKDMGCEQKTIVIYYGTQSVVHLTKHQVFHEQSKHIDVQLHFVRDIVESGEVQVKKISTEDNTADMCSTVLPTNKFLHCMKRLNATSEEEP